MFNDFGTFILIVVQSKRTNNLSLCAVFLLKSLCTTFKHAEGICYLLIFCELCVFSTNKRRFLLVAILE